MSPGQPTAGLCPPRFAAVREAFEANFAQGLELGAGFALAIEGEVVVDLVGGFADRDRSRPFCGETLAPIFSTTKALAALMLAKLVGEGALAYETRVAALWPAFAAEGKGAITVDQALSHQAGLCGLAEPPPDWLDWQDVCARLAAMAPLWPPGRASGYHPLTWGWLAGEIFRRVDGRMLGDALARDVAGPLGLDLFIGLPPSEHHRVAEMKRPPRLPELGPITEPKRLAFFTPWASAAAIPAAAWRAAQIPSANGFATAAALARAMAGFACDGTVGGRRVLAPGAAARAAATQIAGPDLVLPYTIAWGAGLMRNEGLWLWGPGAETVGHAGWGGSCAFADPKRRLSGAYVMNRQSAELIADPRPRRLVEAARAAL